MINRLYDSYCKNISNGVDYFLPWTYEQPLLIRSSSNKSIAQLQKIMYKMINHFVHNYESYEDLMPLSKNASRVIQFFKNKPYQSGSYRTDFIIDENHQFRLIEITCRFALNGFWLSGFLDELAKGYSSKNGLNHKSEYKNFLTHLQSRLEGKEIIILSHKGKGEESRHYQKIIEEAGFEIKKIFVEETEEELKNIENKLFITEFNQEDYFELSDFALEQLSKAAVVNDLRTVFLIHDKRFFTILGDSKIRNKILSEKEIELLDTFYIPTYPYGQNKDKWTLAKAYKNDWILKHKHLGKSAKVFAGLVTDEKEWQHIFESGEIEDMILQPFITQPRFKGQIGTLDFNDYVVGTMLFFDNHYFGLGLFRASSHPVTNVIDDRKVMHLNINEEEKSLDDYIVF